MQEEKIVETPQLPEFDLPSPWTKDSYAAWLQTPNGQRFQENVLSGKWDRNRANLMLRDMANQHSFTSAENRRRGLAGLPQRAVEGVVSAAEQFEGLVEDPTRVVTDPIKMVGEKTKGIESPVLRGAATAGLLAWEIPKGMVVGMAESVYQTARGQMELGEFLDVATLGSGLARGMASRIGMQQATKSVIKQSLKTPPKDLVDAVVKHLLAQENKKAFLSKKLIRAMMNDDVFGPKLQRRFNELKKMGKISGHMEFALLELPNLFVQNEELLLEFLGYVGQRILLKTVEFSKGGINFEQALDQAARDFATQIEQGQGGEYIDDMEEELSDEDVIDMDTEPDIDELSDEEEIVNAGKAADAEAAEAAAGANDDGTETEIIEGEPLETPDEDTETAEGEDEAESEEPTDAEEEVEEEETSEEEIQEQEGETEEEPAEEDESLDDGKSEIRLTLQQAQEQFPNEFSQEGLGELEESDRVTVSVVDAGQEGSRFVIYHDLKEVGGVVRLGEGEEQRILYYANDPKETQEEAQTQSGSANVYSADYNWGEFDVEPAYYPTFDSLSEVIAYTTEQAEAAVGGVLEGTPKRVVWGSNRKAQYQVQYELRELEDVQTSHNPDGTANPAYPTELQPREQRGSTVSLEQVKGYASKLNTEFLLDHFSTLTDGAPILSKKLANNVLSGNARTMALKLAHQQHQQKQEGEPDSQWEVYQKDLREKGKQYGITEEQIEGMSAPVLVQVLVDDVDEVALADDANRASMLEGTSAEQANRDATYLKDDVMVEWKDIGDDFTESLNHDDNQQFRQKLFQNIPAKERNGFLSSDGETISERGARRIRNMMMRYVFQGEYGTKLSEILIEGEFEEIRNINNMIEVILPQLAFMESYFRSGLRDKKYSIAEELARAVRSLDEFTRNQESIDMLLLQYHLLPPKTAIDKLSVPAIQMLFIMNHRKKAFRQMASVFLQYVESVMELDPQQIGLYETEFTKRGFFEHHIFEILFENPTKELQDLVDARGVAQARQTTQEYVNDLMEKIEQQAEERGMQEDPEQESEGEQPTEEPAEEEDGEEAGIEGEEEAAAEEPDEEVGEEELQTPEGLPTSDEHTYTEEEFDVRSRPSPFGNTDKIQVKKEKGFRVENTGIPYADFGVYQAASKTAKVPKEVWVVVDIETGNRITTGDTREDAITHAIWIAHEWGEETYRKELRKPIKEEGLSEEEYSRLYSEYKRAVSNDAKEYFYELIKTVFKGEGRLPDKVDFAQEYLNERNAPELYANTVNRLEQMREAYEPGEAKDVQSEFGALVLQAYDNYVHSGAVSEVRDKTLDLIDFEPGKSRTYQGGINNDIFVTVEERGEDYRIIFDIPGYAKNNIVVGKYGKFTDKAARQAIDEALSKSFQKDTPQERTKFHYGDNPRTTIPGQTEVQKARIEKMPPVIEEKAFKDKNSNTKGGIAYGIPGLDPAMRIKVSFMGDNQYVVYIESDMVNNDSGFAIYQRVGENPLDAVQRTLADVFDDSVWDGLHEDPEPDLEDSLDADGVPGNLPTPLPSQINLIPVETTDGLVWFRIADASGNQNPDYSITVNADPLGLEDGVMEVTVRFPNHDIDAIIEMVQGTTPEEAVTKAISNLMEYEIGNGGLGSGSNEPHQATTSEFLESRPPPVKSSKQPFGKMILDKVAMKRQKYSQSGDIKIYMFEGKHAPEATVRKLGTKEDPMWGVEIRFPRFNAAAGISYASTAQEAVMEVIEKLESSDHNWKPVYKQGLISEIDSVQNAINRRQFATTPAVERRMRGIFSNLRKGLPIDLRGYKISSHKELAILGQLYRHPGMERHIVFYLNEHYEIAGHEVVSFGVPGQTTNPSPARINFDMRRLNAKYFITMHNHPGGPATFSEKSDKKVSKYYRDRYGKQFLGQVVVNSGEYAEAVNYQDKNGEWKTRHRDNIGLSKADLGWDADAKSADFFRRNTSIRPNDPLYQYDVNSETGQIIKNFEQVMSGGGEYSLKNVAIFGKYLQTERNWTTIFFEGHNGIILDVMDYKDLHRLDPLQLWSFIEGEARMRGGYKVSLYVGEGDWYKTKDDIDNSSFNILAGTSEEAKSDKLGVRRMWFAGLQEGAGVYPTTMREMLNFHDSAIARSVSGEVYETTIDSDYGVDTQLTEPSEQLDAFIDTLISQYEIGSYPNANEIYQNMFGQTLDNPYLMEKFVEFVQNRMVLNSGMNPNVADPTELMMVDIELKTKFITHNAHYIARTANITDRDRVLTIGDDSGNLSTFAKLSGAESVETLSTDGYIRKLFNQIVPGVADKIHNIEAANLSREWTGSRPTVILINESREAHQVLDEALKLLAPGGRLVLYDNKGTGFNSLISGVGTKGLKKYWDTLQNRYRVQSVGLGQGSKYYVIDKVQGTPKRESVTNWDEQRNKLEGYRHDRPPLQQSVLDEEFTGIDPGEQTFTQPISNPRLPRGVQLTGKSVSLPSVDAGDGRTDANVANTENVVDINTDTTGVKRGIEGSDITAQDNVDVDMPPTSTTSPMETGEGGVEGVGTGGLDVGENVDTDMAGGFINEPMSVQGGQVQGQNQAEGTTVGRERHRGVESGSLFPLPGISNYETGVVEQTNMLGIPMSKSFVSNADKTPDNTPTQNSSRLHRFLTSPFAYTWLPQTGKRTLELMGRTGRELVESLKRIRNFGDRGSGRGFISLDTVFPEWKTYIRDYAKQENISISESSEQLNKILVLHHEGKSNMPVPDIVDKIVKQTRGFFEENVTVPMLNENKTILKQGLLFNMPGDFVDKGYLSEEHRAAIDMDRATFDKFMRRSGQQARSKGLVQGFVQDNKTGQVYAVFVQQKTFFNKKTGQMEIIPDKTRVNKETGETEVVQRGTLYTLENPFGDQIKLDENPLIDESPDYSLVAYRDPQRQKWTGDRDVAKHLWNSEVSSGLPDPIRDAFQEAGVTFPTGAKFIYSKKANIQQWEVVKDGHELFRIKRIVPIPEKTVETPYGTYTHYSQVHPAYSDFMGKLLVYKANETRDPIFTYRGNIPHKIWTPVENYFPHIIQWEQMSPKQEDGAKFEKFVEYVQQIADANQIPVELAERALLDRMASAQTRKYGQLEQDRQFIFPNFNHNYFQVWEQYVVRSMHRLQTIKEFGQTNDLLIDKLMEFQTADEVMQNMTPVEKSILRLRWYAGYRDFQKGGRGPQYPFREDSGKPITLDPNEADFGGMSPEEWRSLVDAGILELTDDGKYRPSTGTGGILFLENPIFLKGVLAKGAERMKIASDIVTGQLGWKQGDIFDEIFSDTVRRVRNWTGVIYLGRAWAANIAQPVNAAIMTDTRSLLKAYTQFLLSKKHRDYAVEAGAVAIDVMHDYGGDALFGNRLLRQMLGATPRYQVGKYHLLKSYSPFKKHLEDDGIRTSAYTPFFAVEKANRTVSALMARSYATIQLKRMLKNPKYLLRGEAKLQIPGGYALKEKMRQALNVPGLKPDDVQLVSSMMEGEVREQVPHLYPVYDFLAEYAKEMADYTQHRVESMDRGKLWRDNPLWMMAQQLQSFNIAQTKFIKDTFKREWEIAHAFLKETQPLEAMKNKNVARLMGSLTLIPRLLTWGGIFGTPTAILGALVRFKTPDEDTINFVTGVYKAGMFTMVGDYMYQLWRWNRGAEEIMLGPSWSTLADVGSDVFEGAKQKNPLRAIRTPLRLARLPFASPSAYQILQWLYPDSTPTSTSSPARNTRRALPRRTIDRNNIRR